jgi:hypothetical protein
MALGTGHLSPRGLHEGDLEGGSFTENPERYVKYGSGMGVCFHRGPLLGTMEECSFLRAFEIQKYIKIHVKMPCKEVSLSIGALLGNMEGICLPGLFERKRKYMCSFVGPRGH